MAQPNVVREPSMEEILASIRRIIESNDPGAGQAISASVPPVYAEDDDEGDSGEIHLTVDNDNSFADSIEDASAPFEPVRREETSGNVRSIEERRTLSLADVAARVRAASDRQMAQRRAEPEASPQPAPRPMELRPAQDVRQPAAEAARPAAAERSVPDVAGDFDEAPLETLSRVVRPLADLPGIPALRTDELDAFDLDEPEAEQDAGQALISADAGDRVARSFDDLAAALEAGPRRSLDEIAQEMLRPMLKDWLDDNLPTLVERLVREEIERVARGPRR